VEEPDRPAASTRPPAYSDSESVSTAREYFSGGSRLSHHVSSMTS